MYVVYSALAGYGAYGLIYLLLVGKTGSWRLDDEEYYRRLREREAREAYLRRHRDEDT